MELQLANPRHFLLAGMYAQVAFHLSQTMRPVLIPEDALVVRADGPQVAVAGPDHRVHYHHLALGRDHGAQVEVTAGLEEGDLVIVNPTDQVRENSEVEIHKFQ